MGRGHRRHLCKKCSRLGKDELEYLQAIRNIDQCLNWNGRLRHKQRKSFERFRDHPNERVRRYIEELEATWAEERRQWRELRRQEESLAEAWLAEETAMLEAGKATESEREDYPADDLGDDKIPF